MSINKDRNMAKLPTFGRVYFMVTYVDQALELPIVRSVICVGMNLVDTNPKSDEWYFQDVVSYQQFGSFTDISDQDTLKKVEVHRLRPDALSLLFDVEALLSELSEWQTRIK